MVKTFKCFFQNIPFYDLDHRFVTFVFVEKIEKVPIDVLLGICYN